MKPLQAIKNYFAGNSQTQTNQSAPSYGMQRVGGLFNHFNTDDYASSYPSVRAITNEYMAVRPFGIDKNGKKVEQNPIINALYHPNQADSSVSFFEKMATSTLVLPKTYILVWRRENRVSKPGGDFTKPSTVISGFTFLEAPGIEFIDGKTYYTIGAQRFSEMEVLVLPGGVDPHNLYGGYSPTISAYKWAKLDDYIADFQKGFFDNGAVPAGMFIVTAPTAKEYNDIVDMLQEKHRGAGNNNNVTYSHAPIDKSTGKAEQAQIQWIPFAQTNKDIGFAELFDQANKRIDVAYGVPAIVKGIDDAATYANAQVAEKTFAKRAVYPLLLRNYTQLTHELNRITNGMDISITFKYDIPTVADEELVEAQTKEIEGQIIRDMSTAGFSLDSIIEAFKLSTSYQSLKLGTAVTSDIENDKPDVDEGDEVTESPDPDRIDGVTPVNRVVRAEATELSKLESAAREYMQLQVDRAVDEFNDDLPITGVPTDEERDIFVDTMMATIVGILITGGELQYEEGKKIVESLGESTDTLDKFVLSDTAKDSYTSYMRRVGDTYGSGTATSIRNALAEAVENALSKSDTEKLLKNIMNTDDWRVKRLAVTELNRSEGLGSVESMKQIQSETGIEFEKSLSHPQGAQCEFCKAMEGQWVSVTEPLITLGGSVEGVDGGILINDFVQNDGYDPHPNGKGVTVYRRAK